MSTPHVTADLMERFALGEVEEDVAVAVALHLDACASCATLAASLEPLAAAFASVDDPVVPPDLVPSVLYALRSPRRAGPEPAVATGLLALALLSLLLGGAPGDLLIAVASLLRAVLTASEAVLATMVAPAPLLAALGLVALFASALIARSLELHRRLA